MRKALIVVAALVTCGCSVTSSPSTPISSSAVIRPHRSFTPGAINPDVTQDTIAKTICVPGWTKTVRPSASYTDALKIKQIQQYGYADTNPRDYEEDHLIPLELGGSPSNPENLWPEPHPSSFVKDKEENDLHARVCSGTITLDYARNKILADWGPR